MATAPTDGSAGSFGPQEAERLRAVVDELSADLDPWLASLAGLHAAERVAARSYWHHNGFAKLVLEQSATRTTRLHVWPAGPGRAGESNPHGHRWNFGSRVLCGDGITQRRYTEDPSGIAYLRYTYGSREGVRYLAPAGNTWLVEGESVPVLSRQSYAVDTSSVHTVEPLGNAFTATLVAQGVARAESTVVYCRPGRSVDGVDRPMNVEDVLRILRDVRTAIDGTSGSQR